ncbi:MAG: MarR family transcriptional regulator [Bacteroidetes bacterium]|nr:MarR family transcriptional regulator [Bacteroidota bacterium]
MGIENDIKQNKFTSEYQKLFINIAYTNSYLTNILNTFLKPFDLSMQQFNVLRILRGQHPEPVSINSITERMIDKMSNASRLVDKLHKKELIERAVCPKDRRQVDVKLSQKGIEVLKELDELLPVFESTFHHIKSTEAQKINELLDRLRNVPGKM